MNPGIPISPTIQPTIPMQTALQPGPSNNMQCNFCSDPSHFIGRCLIIEQYCQEGKIRHNPEGKVVLSGGGFVPCNIEGQWLHDKVNNWHKQYPGQKVTGWLTSNMNDNAGINPSLFYGIGPQSDVFTDPGLQSPGTAGVLMSSTNDIDHQIMSLQ